VDAASAASAACTQRVTEQLQDARTRERLLRLARRRTASDADAEDLLADALLLVSDPDHSPWDPARGSFRRHVGWVMHDLAIAKRRTWAARSITYDSEIATEEASVDPGPVADEALEARRTLGWLRRLAQALRPRVAHDGRTTKVFELVMSGVEDRAELAAKVPCSVPELGRALETLKYHAKLVRAEDRRAAAARMSDLKAQARMRREELQ
jgi:hypothetical protein